MTGRRCPPRTSPPSWRHAAATCPRREFVQVARLYYDTAEAADAWLDTYGAPRDPRDGQLTPRFESALTGWLRDSAIGPAPCGPAALVWLHAVQAALFVRAIVLYWRPGPLPATRLPGNLTSQVAGALQTAVRTDTAAATALSMHLNHGPAFFGPLQLSDVAPDGSAIRVPPHDTWYTNQRHKRFTPG